MKNNLIVLLVVIYYSAITKSENCDNYGILLYEDIACKPVQSDGETCPSRFDCDFSRPKSGCILKERNFALGEDITSDLTYSGCSIGCRCEEFQFIRCAVLDCPENLGAFSDPGCYSEHVLGKCCAVGQICNNSTYEGKKCEVDGQSYEIGQIFYPKNTCFNCVCHENFTGQYDEETCMRQNCASQIHYTEEINKKCAPAYFNFHSEEVLCCPNHFICPDNTDLINTVNREADQGSGLKCDYGEQKLKLGEGFSRKISKYGKDRNLKCECIMPPLVTCKEA